MSNVHMAWINAVCGRLETRICYSVNIVYNNFPWCNPTEEQKVKIEKTAQGILDARALYPKCSLADLYDELTMPPELRKAHQQNDAQLAANQFRNALHLFPMPESGWTPKVLTYSGFFGYGVKEVWDMVYQYFDFVKANGYFEYRRQEQAKYWMYESVNEQLRNSFYHQPTIADMLKVSEKDVLEGRKTSFVAAKQLLDAYFALLH